MNWREFGQSIIANQLPEAGIQDSILQVTVADEREWTYALQGKWLHGSPRFVFSASAFHSKALQRGDMSKARAKCFKLPWGSACTGRLYSQEMARKPAHPRLIIKAQKPSTQYRTPCVHLTGFPSFFTHAGTRPPVASSKKIFDR